MDRRKLIASAVAATAASAATAAGAAAAPSPTPSAAAPSGTPADAPVAAPAPAAPRPQFLYVLRLVPRLHDEAAWQDTDRQAVARHFAHLKQATADGLVLLAGRTDEPLARTFGLVIFEAADTKAAEAFMRADPAVVAGVMTAELHPYQVALQR